MIRKICDYYEFKINEVTYRRDGKRYITFEYDVVKDKDILNQIKSILDEQPKCDNMNDGDGSKCKDYKRNK